MSPTLSTFKTEFKISCSKFFLVTHLSNLLNIISPSTYRLHVLVFNICLYNFPFFGQSQSFSGELRFQNDALYESLDYGNSRESTLVDL